jgi:hypothetical protein
LLTPGESERQLGDLLNLLAVELDVPGELDAQFTRKYDELAEWLRSDANGRFHCGGVIYPQGSRRLGTMVRPVDPSDDYDIDLVYRRDLKRTGLTQEELKTSVGEQLRRFCAYLSVAGIEVPKLVEGRRCWTLDYSAPFHMDVLPALPDDNASNGRDAEHRILITDRELHLWQPSNPKGYANWLKERMRAALDEQRRAMAKSKGVDIEEIPEDSVKTPLQRVVQLLKRHRDIRYDGPSEDKPISIIITTIAGLAYQGETNVYAALKAAVDAAASVIERRGEAYWLPNPVAPDENFADKWKEHPERAQSFFRWIEQLHGDLESTLEARGLDRVAKSLGVAFGGSAVDGALRRLGHSTRESRITGKLHVAAKTGTLGSSSRGIAVPDHTFYGDSDK